MIFDNIKTKYTRTKFSIKLLRKINKKARIHYENYKLYASVKWKVLNFLLKVKVKGCMFLDVEYAEGLLIKTRRKTRGRSHTWYIKVQRSGAIQVVAELLWRFS